MRRGADVITALSAETVRSNRALAALPQFPSQADVPPRRDCEKRAEDRLHGKSHPIALLY